jgi:ferredoxin-NADP reductase
MTDAASTRHLRVVRIDWEAEGVVSLQLRRDDRQPLPEWSPGAHLELVLPSGLVRHYSLCGDRSDRTSYTIAVLRVHPGRGGSTEIHDTALIGRAIGVRGPRNNFTLHAAPSYVFCAGGIGVTPLLSMMKQATDQGVPWRTYYGGRAAASMAFRHEIAELAARAGARADFLPEDTSGLLPLAQIVAGSGRGAAIYGCGPAGMLTALRSATRAREDLSLHVELFTAPEQEGPAADGAPDEHAHDFVVTLARSGEEVTVTDGTTLLDAVRRVQPDAPFSCEEGYCGTCWTASPSTATPCSTRRSGPPGRR